MAEKLLLFNDTSEWVKNASFADFKPVGSSYGVVFVGNGSGARVTMPELWEIPTKPFTILLNEGFQIAACGFDENMLYVGQTYGYSRCITWRAVPANGLSVEALADSIKYLAFVLRRGNGSPALLPADIEEAGFGIIYDVDESGGVRK